MMFVISTNKALLEKLSDLIDKRCGYPKPALKPDGSVSKFVTERMGGIFKHPAQNRFAFQVPEEYQDKFQNVVDRVQADIDSGKTLTTLEKAIAACRVVETDATWRDRTPVMP